MLFLIASRAITLRRADALYAMIFRHFRHIRQVLLYTR